MSSLGARIRQRRKQLRLSASAVAEAAGMSRMTLYRIERGEPSATMGSYLNVISVLGLSLWVADAGFGSGPPATLPASIRVADYPQLKSVSWQTDDGTELSPREALNLYERGWRHLDPIQMDPSERRLLETLLEFYGKGRPLV